MKNSLKRMTLSITDMRIITKIDGDILYDEPSVFGIDVNNLRVLCFGHKAASLKETEKRFVAPVNLFNNGLLISPESVAYDCVRTVVRASLSKYMHGTKPTIFKTQFDAVVCVSKECDEKDLALIRRVLKDEGAKRVQFVEQKSIENEIKVKKKITPFMKFVILVLLPWLLYLPACVRYGDWLISVQAWFLVVFSVAAVFSRRTRRRMVSRVKKAGLTLPVRKIDLARKIAFFLVVAMIILTICILFFKGRSHELALAYKATLYSVPIAALFFQQYVIAILKESCQYLDRKMILESMFNN